MSAVHSTVEVIPPTGRCFLSSEHRWVRGDPGGDPPKKYFHDPPIFLRFTVLVFQLLISSIMSMGFSHRQEYWTL